MGQAMHVLGQQVYGNSELSAKFCYEPHTTLKNKIKLSIFEFLKMEIRMLPVSLK